MITGWRVFRYRQGARDPSERVSACGADLRRHTQSIFRKEAADSVTIYSTSSVYLELVLSGCRMELRMCVWEMDGTRFVLLEEAALQALAVGIRGGSVCVGSQKRPFTADFYGEGEAAEAYQMMCGRGSAPSSQPAPAGCSAELASRLNALSATEKSRCVEISTVRVETAEELIYRLKGS